jgi:membrane protease YdiL (CAAX protease family)
VFALYHRSPLSLLSLVLAGVYLGFVYQRTGSLYVSMACHFLYNLTIIALTNLRGSVFLLAEDLDGRSLLVAGAATAVLAAMVVLIFLRGAARVRV